MQEKENADSKGDHAAVAKALTAAYDTLKSKNSLADARESIQTFIIYINNVVKNPAETKYRRINIVNVNYQERLGRMPGGQTLLEVLGYKPTGTGFLELDKSRHKEDDQAEILHIQKMAYKFLDKTDEEFQNVPWYDADNNWGCVGAAFEAHDIGRRPTMEDGYIYIDGFAGLRDQGLFAVYDGHGGKATVDFLTCGFHINLSWLLRQNPEMPVSEVLAKCYSHTDQQIRRQQILQSGATSITGLLRKEGNKKMFYSANVGDARGVLCKNSKAIRMSKDHKASDADEKKRIEQAGGFVTKFDRVNGLLAVSRAFGDHLLKPAVSCVPYQTQHEINETTPFAILACDGIWDVMTDQEAVDAVIKALGEKFGKENPLADKTKLQSFIVDMTRDLIKQALDRGSQDNISCMIIYF